MNLRPAHHPGLPFLLGFAVAACSPGADPAAEARITAHADPSTWQRLDDSDPPRRLRDPRTGVVFVRVPPGEFANGPNGARRVRVTKPFLLAETELTVGQWRSYVALRGGDSPVPVPAPGTGDDDLPMPLSWVDADAFCARLGYRLPTEAEWERACRADHDAAPASEAPWGTAERVRDHAWFNANAGDGPQAVGERTPNGFGLHDMLGNVWEWCSDWYADVPFGATVELVDPTGAASGDGHALRGGSWFTPGNPEPARRTQDFPATRNTFYGLRPACGL